MSTNTTIMIVPVNMLTVRVYHAPGLYNTASGSKHAFLPLHNVYRAQSGNRVKPERGGESWDDSTQPLHEGSMCSETLSCFSSSSVFVLFAFSQYISPVNILSKFTQRFGSDFYFPVPSFFCIYCGLYCLPKKSRSPRFFPLG